MMKMTALALCFSLAAGFALQATAQEQAAPEPDCKAPVTQSDMNECAARDSQAADKDLNAQYKQTREAVRNLDRDLDDALKGAEKALVEAQRAWVTFRDADCRLQGFQARGGTMEPLLVSSCLADKSRERTKQLKELADSLR